MRNRTEVIDAAIKFMEGLLGMDYSKTYRYRWYKGGSADCSSLVYGAYLAAGIPLLVDGVERSTSTYEVYADGFDLVFPASNDIIGKTFAPKGFYKDFKFEKGDLIFYSFGSTTRANKITHVAMCYDAEHIIHTANNRDKVCIADMSYGDGRIVAVTRLKSDAEEMERALIERGSAPKLQIRRMQAVLNARGKALNCDGVWGSKTETAIKDFQNEKDLEADGVCGVITWEALLGEREAKEESTEPYVFYRNMRCGNMGEDIEELQKLLIKNGFNCGEKGADGDFGSKTLGAVKTAQKKNDLEDDGVAGRITITALGGVWGVNVPDVPEICTFNVKRGTYKNGTYKKIGEIIKGADVVGIQEVTPAGLKKIAAAAGKTAYMCDTIGGYGHAILTNLSVSNESMTTLKGSGEKRKLHHMMIGDISFYNVHLHYTEGANNTQIKQIAEILEKDTAKTVIMTGDFNRQEFGEIVKLGFTQVNTGQLIKNTEGERSIVNKIDNIFVKGANVKDVWKYEAVKHKYSDHDALFAEVKQ